MNKPFLYSLDGGNTWERGDSEGILVARGTPILVRYFGDPVPAPSPVGGSAELPDCFGIRYVDPSDGKIAWDYCWADRAMANERINDMVQSYVDAHETPPAFELVPLRALATRPVVEGGSADLTDERPPLPETDVTYYAPFQGAKLKYHSLDRIVEWKDRCVAYAIASRPAALAAPAPNTASQVHPDMARPHIPTPKE